eukprot:g30933.t1
MQIAKATQKAIIVKFLEANGFRKDVNCKGTEEEQVCYTYPLHVAVKQETFGAIGWAEKHTWTGLGI